MAFDPERITSEPANSLPALLDQYYADPKFAGSDDELTLYETLDARMTDGDWAVALELLKHKQTYARIAAALASENKPLQCAAASNARNITCGDVDVRPDQAAQTVVWMDPLIELVRLRDEDSLTSALCAICNNCFEPIVAKGIIKHVPTFIKLYEVAAEEFGDSTEHFVVCILDNICTVEELISECQQYGLVELYAARIKADQGVANATMALANLVGHIENHPLLESSMDTIEELVAILESALNKEYYNNDMFMPFLPLQALANLSVNDNNKKFIEKSAVFPLLLRAFDELKDDHRPIQYATKILSNLSFTMDITALQPKFIPILEGLSTSASVPKRVQEYASLALFQESRKHANAKPASAHKKSEQTGTSGQGSTQGHIMLSYPWKYQKFFLWLKTFLESRGYQVWMDVEQMSASVLAAMADAVENASVVIFCLSSDYKQSEACRTEGEYSYNLRKPMIPVKTEAGYKPTGWLGALAGNKLYFEFTNEAEFSARGEQLLKEIERQSGVKASAASATAATTAHVIVEAPASHKPTAGRIVAATSSAGNQGLEQRVQETESAIKEFRAELVPLRQQQDAFVQQLQQLLVVLLAEKAAPKRSRTCSIQ